LLTLELASLTAAPRLKAVVSINDSFMTSDPTKRTSLIIPNKKIRVLGLRFEFKKTNIFAVKTTL